MWICTDGCVCCWFEPRAGVPRPERITVRKAAIKGKWGLLRKPEAKASWVPGDAIMNL